jgi:hypothetical protein
VQCGSAGIAGTREVGTAPALDGAGVDLGERPWQRFGRAEHARIGIREREGRKENADGRLGCWVGLVTGYWAAGGMVLLVQIRSHKHLRYGMEVVHSFAA